MLSRAQPARPSKLYTTAVAYALTPQSITTCAVRAAAAAVRTDAVATSCMTVPLPEATHVAATLNDSIGIGVEERQATAPSASASPPTATQARAWCLSETPSDKDGQVLGWSTRLDATNYAAAGIVPFAYKADEGELYVLLSIQRSDRAPHHHQYTFLGGKVDPADGDDARRTAAREAHEETHRLLCQREVLAVLAGGSQACAAACSCPGSSGEPVAAAVAAASGLDGLGGSGNSSSSDNDDAAEAVAVEGAGPSSSLSLAAAAAAAAAAADADAARVGTGAEAGPGPGSIAAAAAAAAAGSSGDGGGGGTRLRGRGDATRQPLGRAGQAAMGRESTWGGPGEQGSAGEAAACATLPPLGPASAPHAHYPSGRYTLFAVYLPAAWTLPAECDAKVKARDTHPEAAKALGLQWVSFQELTALRATPIARPPGRRQPIHMHHFTAALLRDKRSGVVGVYEWLSRLRDHLRRWHGLPSEPPAAATARSRGSRGLAGGGQEAGRTREAKQAAVAGAAERQGASDDAAGGRRGSPTDDHAESPEETLAAEGEERKRMTAGARGIPADLGEEAEVQELVAALAEDHKDMTSRSSSEGRTATVRGERLVRRMQVEAEQADRDVQSPRGLKSAENRASGGPSSRPLPTYRPPPPMLPLPPGNVGGLPSRPPSPMSAALPPPPLSLSRPPTKLECSPRSLVPEKAKKGQKGPEAQSLSNQPQPLAQHSSASTAVVSDEASAAAAAPPDGPAAGSAASQPQTPPSGLAPGSQAGAALPAEPGVPLVALSPVPKPHPQQQQTAGLERPNSPATAPMAGGVPAPHTSVLLPRPPPAAPALATATIPAAAAAAALLSPSTADSRPLPWPVPQSPSPPRSWTLWRADGTSLTPEAGAPRPERTVLRPLHRASSSSPPAPQATQPQPPAPQHAAAQPQSAPQHAAAQSQSVQPQSAQPQSLEQHQQEVALTEAQQLLQKLQSLQRQQQEVLKRFGAIQQDWQQQQPPPQPPPPQQQQQHQGSLQQPTTQQEGPQVGEPQPLASAAAAGWAPEPAAERLESGPQPQLQLQPPSQGREQHVLEAAEAPVAAHEQQPQRSPGEPLPVAATAAAEAQGRTSPPVPSRPPHSDEEQLREQDKEQTAAAAAASTPVAAAAAGTPAGAGGSFTVWRLECGPERKDWGDRMRFDCSALYGPSSSASSRRWRSPAASDGHSGSNGAGSSGGGGGGSSSVMHVEAQRLFRPPSASSANLPRSPKGSPGRRREQPQQGQQRGPQQKPPPQPSGSQQQGQEQEQERQQQQ